MSTTLRCDYCDREINGLCMTLKCNGDVPVEGLLRDSRWIIQEVGHFHSHRDDGRPSCYDRMCQAIGGLFGAGSEDSLESIPVASHQKVASMRRTFTKGGEDE